MKRDEARTLRCPFMDGDLCIADRCMAWRTETWVEDTGKAGLPIRVKPHEGYCVLMTRKDPLDVEK